MFCQMRRQSQTNNRKMRDLEQGAQARNLLGRHVGRDDLERLLLELVHARKAAHAREDDIVERLVGGGAILLHPVVLQDLVRGRAFPGVLLQHRLDGGLGAGGDVGPGLGVEVDVALEDGVKDLLLRLTPKRRHAREQDVQYDAAAPHVRFHAILPPQHLRRNVVCAAHNVGEGLPGLEEDGQAKVGGLEGCIVIAVGEQEVFWFEVPADGGFCWLSPLVYTGTLSCNAD